AARAWTDARDDGSDALRRPPRYDSRRGEGIADRKRVERQSIDGAAVAGDVRHERRLAPFPTKQGARQDVLPGDARGGLICAAADAVAADAGIDRPARPERDSIDEERSDGRRMPMRVDA